MATTDDSASTPTSDPITEETPAPTPTKATKAKSDPEPEVVDIDAGYPDGTYPETGTFGYITEEQS